MTALSHFTYVWVWPYPKVTHNHGDSVRICGMFYICNGLSHLKVVKRLQTWKRSQMWKPAVTNAKCFLWSIPSSLATLRFRMTDSSTISFGPWHYLNMLLLLNHPEPLVTLGFRMIDSTAISFDTYYNLIHMTDSSAICFCTYHNLSTINAINLHEIRE